MNESKPRLIFRILLALFYGFAGYAHLVRPETFLAITPDWVPFAEPLIFWTGIAEIAGAVGLLMPARRLRQAAGIGLALYALCAWPANIHHAVNNIAIGGETLSWWYHGPRLMAQPLIIWLALWVGGVTQWPFNRQK